MKITDDMLRDAQQCSRKNCSNCAMKEYSVNCASSLATELLAERAKPKVWDDVQKRFDFVHTYYSSKTGESIIGKTYTRELPKSRARIIAEKVYDGMMEGLAGNKIICDRIEEVLIREGIK